MTAYSSSFKLHLLAGPSAFDVDAAKERLFVATNEGIQTIRLPHLAAGASSRIIHYDQPQVVKKVSSHGNYLSVLRGGVVTVWDVGQSLSPLKSLLHTPNTFIVDFHIPPMEPSLLATCFDTGEVLVYDIRSGGVAYKSSLPPQRNLTRIEQSNDYIAVSGSSTLTVMDVRYMSPECNDRCVMDLDLGAQIQQFTWCSPTTLATGYGGSISFWDTESAMKLSTEYPFPGSYFQKFLSSSIGTTLVVASGEKSSAGGVKISAVRVPEQTSDSERDHCLDLAVLKGGLIGLTLGSPGQLVPPYDSGLELLMLSQNSVLHALKVIDGPFTRSRTTSVRSSPNFPARDLRRDMRKVQVGDYFGESLRDQVLELEELIEIGDQRGLSIVSVDPYAKQGMISVFWFPDLM